MLDIVKPFHTKGTLFILVVFVFLFTILSGVFLQTVSTDADINFEVKEKSSGNMEITFEEDYNGTIYIAIQEKVGSIYPSLEETSVKHINGVKEGDTVKIRISDNRYLKVYASEQDKVLKDNIINLYYNSQERKESITYNPK